MKDRTFETCLRVDKREGKDDSRALGLDDSDNGWALNRRRKNGFENKYLDLRGGHTSPCPAVMSQRVVRSAGRPIGTGARISGSARID